MNIRFLIIATSLLILASSMQGQYGLRLKYGFNDYSTAERDLIERFGTDNVFNSSYEVGVDYWFRLKNKRIEFYPELAFGIGRTSISDEVFSSMALNRLGFNFNTHFYLLDFVEDCNCPTFSKEGPSISKGFFIHFSPGLTYETYSMNTNVGNVNKSQSFSGKIGGGVGIDVGISDLVTLTPIYTYNVYFGNDWDINTFPDQSEPILRTSTVNNQHLLTLRVGVRLDYR